MTESSTHKDFKEAFRDTSDELLLLTQQAVKYYKRIGKTRIYLQLGKVIEANLWLSKTVNNNAILYKLTQQLHDEFGITTFIDDLRHNLRLGKKIIKDIEHINGQITSFANN